MITFFKGITASWRASLATVVTLAVSATVLGLLLSIAFGGAGGTDDGSEGQGLASSFSVITGVSAIMATRGIQMHSYGLRENLIGLLRDTGFSWNRIRFLAMAESWLLVLVSFPLSLILGWVLAPAVGAYLRSVGVLHPHESASITVTGAAAALLTMFLISTVCSFLAIRSFSRREAKTAKSAEAAPGRTRRFLGVAAPVTLLAGTAVLWSAAGFVVSGVGLAFFGALLSFIVLPWVLAHLLPGLGTVIGKQLKSTRPILHTVLRRRASSRSVGVTYGAMICILGGTIFGAHFYIADSAARNSWLSLLEGSAVSVTDGAPAANVTTTADTVTLNHVEGEVVSEGSRENVWLTADDASRLLGPRVVAGSLSTSTEGVAVTHSTAQGYGIQLGDLSIVTRSGSRLPVTAFIEIPDTVGSYFVVSEEAPAELTVTGARTMIALAGEQEHSTARDGTGFSPAAAWVAGIPAGQIVSNSGGAGVSEAALLMAAPVLLGFTLMLSSRIITNDSQRSSRLVLASLGASRTIRRKMAVTESIAEVLVPGAAAGAMAVCVMLWADRLVIAGLGAGPALLSVVAIPCSLLMLLCLVDVAVQLVEPRRSHAA